MGLSASRLSDRGEVSVEDERGSTRAPASTRVALVLSLIRVLNLDFAG